MNIAWWHEFSAFTGRKPSGQDGHEGSTLAQLPQGPPAGHPHPPALGANVRVLRRDRFGGLIHEYFQVHRVTAFSAPTRPRPAGDRP